MDNKQLKTQKLEHYSYRFGERHGHKNHLSASNGETFSSSAISRELSALISDHIASNSNPA